MSFRERASCEVVFLLLPSFSYRVFFLFLSSSGLYRVSIYRVYGDDLRQHWVLHRFGSQVYPVSDYRVVQLGFSIDFQSIFIYWGREKKERKLNYKKSKKSNRIAETSIFCPMNQTCCHTEERKKTNKRLTKLGGIKNNWDGYKTTTTTPLD